MSTPETYNRIVAVGVDIQNDFIPGGSLAVEGGDKIVRPFNELAAWVRQEHEGIVAFTRDWHPEQTSHFGFPPNFETTWPVHCVANTLGASFHPDLDVRDTDPVLSKGTLPDEDAYSGFQAVTHDGLTLETLTRPLLHERVAVVIGGLATDYCVKATVLDALRFAKHYETDPKRDIGVFVLSDLIKAVAPESGAKAIEEMKEAGVRFITSAELIEGQVIEVRESQWSR